MKVQQEFGFEHVQVKILTTYSSGDIAWVVRCIKSGPQVNVQDWKIHIGKGH